MTTESIKKDNAYYGRDDEICPKCKSDLVYKQGRYGRFIGCCAYPECRHIESLNKPKALDIDCPMCKKNKILERKSRYGKIFYGCTSYPKCENAMWTKPERFDCPSCGNPIMCDRVTKREGHQLQCPKCKHKVAIEETPFAPEAEQ